VLRFRYLRILFLQVGVLQAKIRTNYYPVETVYVDTISFFWDVFDDLYL